MATRRHNSNTDTLKRNCECAICMEPYQDPRILINCGHQFCEICLRSMIKLNPEPVIPCPICCVETTPGNGDTKTLPRAIQYRQLQDLIFDPTEDDDILPPESDESKEHLCSKCRKEQRYRQRHFHQIE